jgi:hypothetical protein
MGKVITQASALPRAKVMIIRQATTLNERGT